MADRAIGFYNAMAGDDQWQGVLGHHCPDGSCGFWIVDEFGKLTITDCFRRKNKKVRKPEPAIRRVLSSTTIHLGQSSPTASSNLPGSPLRHAVQAIKPAHPPIWSCSRRGLPCRELLPVARCALTAPFHPYRPGSAVCFLWHFP